MSQNFSNQYLFATNLHTSPSLL